MELLKEFFNNPALFFSAMDAEQSNMALLLAGILYLLGLWTAWLIWGRMARRRKKAIRKLESDYNTLDAEHKVLVGQQEQLRADHEVLQTEKEELTISLENAEREKRAFKQQALTFKDENIGLQTDVETYLRKIDTMDTQMLNISTKNTQLEEELEKTGNAMNSIASVQSSFNTTKDRLTIVESRISDLVGENQNLRVELSRIKETGPLMAPVNVVASSQDATTSQEEGDFVEEEASNNSNIIEARQAIQKAIGKKIKIASVDDKDELQKINGIGSFLEDQLNELGFYTYEQLCAWDDEMIELVTTAIEYFPGRIQKDDWRGQACKMKGAKISEPADKVQTYSEIVPATQPKNISSTPEPVESIQSKKTKKFKTDDLKVVEGIGPKIENLLKDAGIKNWSDLSATKVDYLKEILTAAGGRFRLAMPDTWAKQAQMAVDGKWEQLQAYQDVLDGGKETKK